MTFLFVLAVGLGTIMMVSAYDDVSMRDEFLLIISGQWHNKTTTQTSNSNTTPNGGNSGSGPLVLPRR